MRKNLILSVTLLSPGAILPGCGEGGNTVVEQPDEQQLQAKRQEFADFQKKMAAQSQLPSKK